MQEIIFKLLNCFIVISPYPRLLSRRGPSCDSSQFNNRLNRGFTLVELLIVIAVLGILTTGVLIALNVGGTLDKANIAKAKVFSKSIESDRPSQVGKWSFEEQTGILSRDSSSFSNNGTLSSSSMWRDKDQCGLGFGGCLEFDGSSNYVEYTGLDDFTATSLKTISAWFKLNADGSNDDSSQPVVTIPFFRIYVRNATNNVIAQTFDFGGGRESPEKEIGTGDRDWHHAAGVFSWNGSTTTQTLTLYVDGTFIGSSDYIVEPVMPFFKYIGRYGIGYFSGFIDEVSIYNQALTAYRVRQLYARGVIRRAIAYK